MNIANEVKKIPDMPRTQTIDANDMIVVQLVNGATKRMFYGDLVLALRDSFGLSAESSYLTTDDIASIWTETGKKVPGIELVKSLNDLGVVMFREQKAAYGYFGIQQNLDELMTFVRAGAWDKFAVGDWFLDIGSQGETVQWEVTDKNGYLKCGDTPFGQNHIICCPRDCLHTTYKYNDTNTNTGGYAASKMPANLELEADKFSAKLQGYMKQVRRLENNKGTWAWATRRIFLPSNPEIVGHAGFSDPYCGGPVCHSLALFTGGNAHVMKGRGYNKQDADRQWYWTADPSGQNTTNFCDVDTCGHSAYYGASNSTGVAPLIVLA